MALFKVSKGLDTNLPEALTEGYCWYTYDNSKFYIDFKDENGVLSRKALNAQEAEKLTGYDIATILSSSEVEIPTSKSVWDAINNITADDLGIYVQATEPTDAEDGAIWIDTANDPEYIVPHVPEVTEADNGKVLMVVNGKWQAVTLNISVDENGVLSI